MLVIIKFHGVFVIKHGFSFLKRNSVLFKIFYRLVFIPLKLYFVPYIYIVATMYLMSNIFL